MLTEQRFEQILKLLEEKGTITVKELTKQLETSESTIRRDLTVLDQNGKLIKVFGGAVALDSHVFTKDMEVSDRKNINREEKVRIAKYAAALIKTNDFVYIDAGTTTGYMIDFLTEKQATYVTNGVSHAKRLAAAGFPVLLIGGELKASTEAVVGSTAVTAIQKYHFTIGFFGTNGIDTKNGFTTPDHDEAMVKQVAIEQTDSRFILCDHEKFSQVSMVSFCALEDANVITDKKPAKEYKGLTGKRLIVAEA